MKLEFIENPVVGKFYDVPCIDFYGTFLPILPHKHSDAQFGTKAAAKPHYHYDTRFFRKADWQQVGISDFQRRVGSIHTHWSNDEIKILRRKCQRAFTGLKPAEKFNEQSKSWYRKQIGKSCKGAICPHFKQKMIERDGVLECPYHGLIADIKTEKVIGNIHGIEKI